MLIHREIRRRAVVAGLSCTLLIAARLADLARHAGAGQHRPVRGAAQVLRVSCSSIHHAGPIAIPLPGAALVMAVLFVNLMLGGILRMRKEARPRWGMLVTHVGILLLIVAGLREDAFAEDGTRHAVRGPALEHVRELPPLGGRGHSSRSTSGELRESVVSPGALRERRPRREAGCAHQASCPSSSRSRTSRQLRACCRRARW
jgi:hypothetical protein